jgi:dipeptide/tripeptide permease
VAAVLSTMMAVWFLSSSWAQWLGGLIAQMTASDSRPMSACSGRSASGRSFWVWRSAP